MIRTIMITLTLGLLAASSQAEIKPERLRAETFQGAGSHGILVNSFDNRAEIFNAETGEMLGQLALGIGANVVEIDADNRLFHVAETYLSRHTRGERTDVVTSYEFDTLSAKGEVKIPAKHASGSPIRSYTGITDDARFMMVNNISPAMSISVVDLKRSTFVGEIMTAGCGLVYPAGERSFLQLCGDGSAQLIVLNDDGSEDARVRSSRFFSVQEDPLMEKGVRTANGWIFTTFSGQLYELSVDDDEIAVTALFKLDQEGTGWRPGGMQPVAYHSGAELLLVSMHEGGENTHKNPGTEIWIFDLPSQRRIHRLKLENMATSIAVSQDDEPLVYTAFVGSTTLDVYDLRKARLVNSIANLNPTPTILQSFQP